MTARSVSRLALAVVLLLGMLLAWPATPARAAGPDFYGAAGVNGAWLTGTDAAWPADFEAHGIIWTSLTPHIDLYGSLQYGFSNSYLRGIGGAKVTATDVNDPNFSLYLLAGYRGGSVDALQPSEWATGAGFGWRPSPENWPRFLIAGEASLGMESNLVIVHAGPRVYFGPLKF